MILWLVMRLLFGWWKIAMVGRCKLSQLIVNRFWVVVVRLWGQVVFRWQLIANNRFMVFRIMWVVGMTGGQVVMSWGLVACMCYFRMMRLRYKVLFAWCLIGVW